MNISELKDLKIKLDSLEDFKKIVEEALGGECKWKEHGYWLSEEYEEGKILDSNYYKARILCVNESRRNETEVFKHGHKKASSITAYNIHYSNSHGGGFVINVIILSYDAIKAIKGLNEVAVKP